MFYNLNGLLTEITEGQVNGLIGFILGILIFVIAIAIAIYVIMGLFLSKFNKLVYGKGDVCAWIPYGQTYLLGKLGYNKLVGIILLILNIVSGLTVKTTNGESTSMFPALSGLYTIGYIIILILAISRYNKVKKGEMSKEQAAFLIEQMTLKKNDITSTYANPQEQSQQATTVPQTPPPPTGVENPPKSFCSNCGAQLVSESAFCQQCGQQVQR